MSVSRMSSWSSSSDSSSIACNYKNRWWVMPRRNYDKYSFTYKNKNIMNLRWLKDFHLTHFNVVTLKAKVLSLTAKVIFLRAKVIYLNAKVIFLKAKVFSPKAEGLLLKVKIL